VTIRLLGRTEIRNLAKELDFKPRKSLGQNFVHDANTVRRIVSASGVNKADHVLEVGPGLGSLTLALLDRGARVTAIEIDPVLAQRLPRTIAEHSHSEIHRLTVLNQDILGIERSDLAELPTAVVAHGIQDDPVFCYGNHLALELFELDFAAFTALPSRYSAEPLAREERAALLERVSRFGFIDDYAGVRISSSGRRFRIRNATVWNLMDEAGQYRGQAAAFSDWSPV